MFSKRLYGAALMTAIVLPLGLQGCGEDNPLCCTEFQVGANIDANIGGSIESQVAVQAVADFAGIASAIIDDLTTSCRSMAQDLDAPKADQEAAEANEDRQAKMEAWCSAAVKAIGSVKATAGGSITIKAEAPKCEASISAKANCQAKCSVDGKCDIKANPPKCTGGKLQVSCQGSCEAEGGASVSCEGSCNATCEGSCTATGGVQCTGKCEGTCKGAAEGGTGTGIKADGTCDGTCEGTCEVVAPGVECKGSCNGSCTGKCEAKAGVSVKCDGKCDGEFEPISCEGGKLEGGCQVSAECDANCDASVSAKAECTPPSVSIELSGTANVEAAAKLQATLKANFGAILALEARLKGMATFAGTLSANASGLADIKVACLPLVGKAALTAAADVGASVKATGSLVASVGS